MKLKSLSLLVLLFSSIFSQAEKNTFNLKEKNLGLTINHDQDGLFSDQYFHYNLNSGLFSEIYINDFTFNKNRNTIYNLSLGYIQDIKDQIIVGIGYTNYFNKLNNIEHEIFIGSNLSFISGILYFDIVEKVLSFQSILNLNSIVKNFPLSLTYSNTFNGENFEQFFDISKTFNNEFFVGYILSREQFEDTRTISYSKGGKTGTYDVIEDGISVFNEFYIGFYF